MRNQKISEENKKVESIKEENKDEHYDDDYKNVNEDYENEDDDDEIITGLNDFLDEMIDKSKSFKDQIESLKKLEDLKGYQP